LDAALAAWLEVCLLFFVMNIPPPFAYKITYRKFECNRVYLKQNDILLHLVTVL
jgi:hypothetical protein